MQHQAIWPADKVMTVPDALIVSLSGMATVFVTLIVLALLIVLLGKVLNALGVGEKSTKKAPAKAQTSQAAKTASGGSAAVQAKPQQSEEEIAAIIAAVSDFSRVPIERLKINSITEIKK
ncbi:OadG family transporter subunit [Criibacterium bergeronii]|nr:OadG family transporter subunit [Criibacterium bergeronii]